MNRLLWLPILGYALTVGAAERPRDFGALAPITAAAPEGLQRLHLPLATLQASRSPGLADLRLFNANGESLPWAELPDPVARPPTMNMPPLFAWPGRTAPSASSPLKVEVNAAGAIVRIAGQGSVPANTPPANWLLDVSVRPPDARLHTLVLDWNGSGAGVQASARVDGSDDFEHWRPMGEATLVELPASATSATGISQKRIDINDALPPKYLRLRVDPPLALRSVQAEWLGRATPEFDAAQMNFNAVDGSGERRWILDLGAPLPLARLRIHLPQPNSVAMLHLERETADGRAWLPVRSDTVYRLNREGRELRSPAWELPAGIEARRWRLTLDRQTSTLVAPTLAATVEWPAQWIAFAARAPGPFQLAIGRERTPSNALPPATLLPDWRPGEEARLPLATVGEPGRQRQVERGAWQSIMEATPEDRRRWVLWGVLAAAVIGLAALARRLMKDLSAPRT